MRKTEKTPNNENDQLKSGVERGNQSSVLDRITVSSGIKEIGETLRDPIWEDVKVRINRSVRYRLRTKIAIAAASLTLLLGLSNYFSYQQGYKQQNSQLVKIVNPLGIRSSLVLSDGTKVTMNAGTTLTYPSAFIGDTRKVEVHGEAFFDVSSDCNRSFIVKSGDLRVKVFGTKFNVKSYEEENTVEVTLVEGKVGVKIQNQPGLVYINPAEQIVFAKDKQTHSVRQVDLNPYIAWKEGKYYFKNQSFKDIVKQLERAFNVQIHITSDKLRNTLFSGDFIQGENLEQILRVITVDQRMHYRSENNQIYIEEKK